MEIGSIGAPDGNAVSRRAAIDQEDFLRVLLTQLQFQDPLEPLDNNEFIAQFAELTNLEQTQQLNDKMDTMLTVENSGQAIGLLGKTVQAATDTGDVVGTVTLVAFNNGRPAIAIRTATGGFVLDLTLGQIEVVRDPVRPIAP